MPQAPAVVSAARERVEEGPDAAGTSAGATRKRHPRSSGAGASSHQARCLLIVQGERELEANPNARFDRRSSRASARRCAPAAAQFLEAVATSGVPRIENRL